MKPLSLLTILAVVVSNAQTVRPWQAGSTQPKTPSQRTVTSVETTAPQPSAVLPWEADEQRWWGLDGLLPGVLDRIPPCSLDPAVKEVDKVAVLAGATFASKVKYWRTQADQLSEVEKRYGEYIKDIPRRQEEMDVLFKVSQAEIADLDQRRARLETALMSAGLQPQNAQARLDRIQEIAQSQTEAMKAHRAALDQRLANLGSASEYIRQLRRVYQQYRDSAMIEQNLWREHYEALKDLRQMLWSRCRLLSAPEEGSRSCLGFIRIPGSDHGCRPDQKKDK